MNEEENTPLLFKIAVILIIMGTAFGTFMGIVNFAFIRSLSNELSDLNKNTVGNINGRLNKIDSEITSLKEDIQPGGIVDEYINAYNFLSNTNFDLEKLLTFASANASSTYFTVYVTGSSNVWINVSRGGQSILQVDLKPGLSNYAFFVSGKPDVKTFYTLSVDLSTIITSSDASSTYFLVAINGSANLIKMKTSSVSVSNILR